MSEYWNYTSFTGLTEGKNRDGRTPYSDGESATHLLARSATDGTERGDDPATGDPLPPGPTQGPSVSNIEPGQEDLGLYVAQDVNPIAPDRYYTLDETTPYLFALSGPEFQAGSTVQRTFQWVSQSAEAIRDRKLAEGDAHADTVAFSSAQTNDNPNVYVITDQLHLAFYNVVGNFYADRHKDRVLGQDSAVGYDPSRPAGTPPGPDPVPATYWARDVPVRLVNAQNQNRLQLNADEEDWGQVLKEVGNHLLDTIDALTNYKNAVIAEYNDYVNTPNEANRTALVSLDPTDGSWGFPPYYDGPSNGVFRVITRP